MIAKGDLDITGSQLPCFLFPFGQANDLSALDTILSGPILLRVSFFFCLLILHLHAHVRARKGC